MGSHPDGCGFRSSLQQRFSQPCSSRLVAGFANKENRIEVKTRVNLAGWGKPVTAPIWIKLIGTDHCSEDLAAVPSAWTGAIEIDASGRLASFA